MDSLWNKVLHIMMAREFLQDPLMEFYQNLECLIQEFKALFSSWYFRPLGTSGSMLLLMNSTLIATSEISSLCAAEDDPNHV